MASHFGTLKWGVGGLLLLAATLSNAGQPPPAAPSLSQPSSIEAEPPRPLRADDREVAKFFDDYIAKTIDDLELPGGAVVVVRDGRTILAKEYGYTDLASKQPVDVNNSLFRAASISKLMPWLLVMQLVEEGRIDLDQDVNAYLDFRIPDAFGRPITMRHLMTHTAGFADRFHGVFDPDVSDPLGQVLQENIPDRVYAPGSTVAYSNYGAALAGYIVQRRHGRPWEQIVAERIFRPAGMNRSTVAQPVSPTFEPLLVSTYNHGSSEPAPFRTTPLAPMGSLTASAADMGRLLAILLRQGEGTSGRVVTPASISRMTTLERPLGPGLEAGLGLGLLVGEYRGVRYAGHAGNMTTLATDLELLPDHGLGWYYVFNGQGWNEQARKVRADLLYAVIDELVAPSTANVRARGPSSAQDLAGSYVSTRRQRSGPLMFGALMDTAEIYPQKDGTLYTLASGVALHWLPDGRDRFVEEESGIALAVTRGNDGRVARIASPLLFPAAEFERAPDFVQWVEPVTKFSLVTLLLAVLAAPIAWTLRRRRRKIATAGAAYEATRTGPSNADLIIKRWARISFWMIVATLAAWGLFALVVAMNMAFLFTAPGIVRVALGILTLLSAPFAAIILADALLAWRDPGRGWLSRIGGVLVAAAAIGIAWLFYVFDIANFSTDW